MPIAQELPIDLNASAMTMAEEIFGEGVQVVSADYSGDRRSSGTYSDGDTISAETTPGDTGVILSTGRARDYTNSSNNWWGGGSTNTNQASNTSTDTRGIDNDAAFNAAAGTSTYDASILEMEFIPTGDMMTIQFVFSSEEYPEYTDSLYQDFIGIWINGEYVQLGVGDGDIDPNNINSGNNESLFISNLNDEYNTEMDGFTATMTLTMPVNSGDVNTLRIGIADVTDSRYDSTLLIAGGSVQTALVAEDDVVNIAPDGSQVVDLMANDDGPGGATLILTHINGQEVSVGDVITFSTGQQIQINGDGTVTVLADGDEESVNFSYTTSVGGSDLSDTAFVTINQVPCFVAGTRVRTPDGYVAVDDLQAGDLVVTKDDGVQPISWIGSREVEGTGDFAPIHIRKNTFGHHRALQLSPLHRVLVRDGLSEILFGTAEVLVAVKELINGHSVRQIPTDHVTYVHLMFEKHQIVWAEGLETESFLPGPQIVNSFEQETMAEICSIFPELDPETGAGYGKAARRTLRGYEANLLIREQAVA